MRKLALILAALVCLLAISGCGPQKTSDPASETAGMTIPNEFGEPSVAPEDRTKTTPNPVPDDTAPSQDVSPTPPESAPSATPAPTPSQQPKQSAAAEPSVTKAPTQNSPSPKPTTKATATPAPTPKSTPVPTPKQTPRPTPTPEQTPEPQESRTICNTCGADITGNVPAHGTEHLLKGENFSYRVE